MHVYDIELNYIKYAYIITFYYRALIIFLLYIYLEM